MRIDDIYEYDLDKPIYINDDSKSSFYKDGVIKKEIIYLLAKY